MVPVERAVAAAAQLKARGYFERVREGNQKAASLFVRLLAYTLNPNGIESDFGCLSKSPGETQVDGFAEDAIVYGNDPVNLFNVLDMISGAGAPGADLSGQMKERRPSNRWIKPQPLDEAQLRYLNPEHVSTAAPSAPAPVAVPGNAALNEQLAQLVGRIDMLGAILARLEGRVIDAHDAALDAKLVAADARKALSNGLAVTVEGKLGFVGNAKLSGVARG